MDLKVTVIPASSFFGKVKYHLDEDFEMCGVRVPAGNISDGASVPTWLTPVGSVLLILAVIFTKNPCIIGTACFIVNIPFIFPRAGEYLAAAIVHDFHVGSEQYPLSKSDKIFKECLKEIGISPIRYWPMYIAVRIFGVIRKYVWQPLSKCYKRFKNKGE